jgi:hypothetical protein
MRTSIFVLSALFATLSVVKAVNPLPGSGLIMQTFDILAPESTIVTQIIDLTYNEGRHTPNNDYLVPDGMIYSETPYCQFTGETISSSSY